MHWTSILFAFIKMKKKTSMMAHGKNINVNLCKICLKGTAVMLFSQLFKLILEILDIDSILCILPPFKT